MDNNLFWSDLKTAFGSQKVFWVEKENAKKPGITDRLIHYVISYYENPAVARKAVRLFRGVTLNEFETTLFCGWNEVRVSTLREINNALKTSGATGDSWELAVTIRDFLENIWNTVHTTDLSEVPQEDRVGYLMQLQGKGTWGKQITKESKNKPCPTPFRPDFSAFYKHCHKYRKPGEQILPKCAISYLDYLWKRTRCAPYENHANRILSRLGIFNATDPLGTKISKFESLITAEKPISKHKHLIQLGKVVCLSSNPRCSICPVAKHCSRAGLDNA
jgi:hypothetical protein